MNLMAGLLQLHIYNIAISCISKKTGAQKSLKHLTKTDLPAFFFCQNELSKDGEDYGELIKSIKFKVKQKRGIIRGQVKLDYIQLKRDH